MLIIKERGLGGTLGAKGIVVRGFLRHGHEFVWLRTSDVDVKAMSKGKGSQFFDDLPHIGINVEGDIDEEEEIEGKVLNFIAGNKIRIKGEIAGHIMPLSLFDQFKGNSFSKVKWIIFDEFIATSNKRVNYDVLEAFSNMVETIARTRPDVRIICIANSINKGHPLLVKLGFEIGDFGFYFNKHKDPALHKFAVLHYAQSPADYALKHKNSTSGKLASLLGTDEIILANTFETSNNRMIPKGLKLGRMKQLFKIFTQQGSFRVDRRLEDDLLYVRVNYNKDTKEAYTTDRSLVDSKIKPLPIREKKGLIQVLSDGKVVFENEYVEQLYYLSMGA